EPVVVESRRNRLLLGPADELENRAPQVWWNHPLWDGLPQLASPFDDEFSFHPHPETEDEYFGAPF
ncbi:MAG TPA: hypothetical protein VFV87_18835, partial [Pirellulaceae bacterium]|nr:hypothetical protein [Pirellulaceae bacterium]